MSDETPTPERFYRERIPAQWNQALREQEMAVETAKRTLDGMRGVNATIRVVVEGEPTEQFFMNIAEGTMSAGEAAAREPFLTVIQDRKAFERLVEESGDSALAMLGGLSGLASEMKLTSARMVLLEGVTGTLRFEVTGERGFALLTHFGTDPIPDEPTTSIRVAPEGYEALKSGALDPQNAFMTGQIEVEGDMQLAMQLALAALTPD